MLNLHVIQADYGDCFLLEYRGNESSKFILFDGGPSNIYGKHLKYALKDKVPEKGRIDLIVLTHIDNDHICGIINLLKKTKLDKKKDSSLSLQIDGIWHNTFKQNIGINSNIASRVLDLAKCAELKGLLSSLPEETVRGFSQGEQISKLAEYLNIPINVGFNDKLIICENALTPWVMEDMRIWTIGPNRRSLERLQKEWLVWLEANATKPAIRDSKDTSIPNLSSIMLLIEAGERKILLPGDGTGRDVVDGLKNLGKLDTSGKIHVDILKLPHHGSIRNVFEDFFEIVIADTFVVSANGQNNNPELGTLEWIVRSAKRQQRTIKIFATNETISTNALVQKFDRYDFGYSMEYMKSGQHYITV